MRLHLDRTDQRLTYTRGILIAYDDADTELFRLHTLEDAIRAIKPNGEGKIFGQTAILAGVYRVLLTLSPKFGKILPLLLGVLHFTGIRIHGGTRVEHTEGCILVGTSAIGNRLFGSPDAMKKLKAFLIVATANDKPCYITITNPDS